RVLGVELAEGVHLLVADHGGGLGALARHHHGDVRDGIHPAGGGQGLRDLHAGGAHRDDAAGLSLEVGQLLHRAVGRHRDAVDVPLVRGVEDLRLHPLRAGGRERLHARQREEHLLGHHRLGAVGGAGERHQLHLDAVLLVPPHLGGHRERRRRAGDGLRAPPHADLGLGGGGDRQEQRRRHGGQQGEAAAHGTETSDHALTLSWSRRSFSDGSQKSTRLRIIVTPRLRSSPSTDRIRRMENCPDTSMLKFIDWMSMPSPCWAPTNSATMAPIRAKIMATSSPAMTKGKALGRRNIQKICRSLAASERIRLTRSSSAERSPTMVFTRSGKNAIRAALMTLEVRPSPNHTTMSGASATLGSDWNITMYGKRKNSIGRLSATAVPSTSPRVDPAMKPS